MTRFYVVILFSSKLFRQIKIPNFIGEYIWKENTY